MGPLDIQTSVRQWNTGLKQLPQTATPEELSACISHYKYTREAIRLHTVRRSLIFFMFHWITYQLRKYNTDTWNISLPSVPSSSDLSLTFTIPTTWQRGRYNDRLLPGRSMVQILGEKRYVSLLKHAQTASGVHQASCSVGTGRLVLWGSSGWSVKLNIHLHLAPIIMNA